MSNEQHHTNFRCKNSTYHNVFISEIDQQFYDLNQYQFGCLLFDCNKVHKIPTSGISKAHHIHFENIHECIAFISKNLIKFIHQ